ncbi:MAG: hypothetical protein JO092_01330 [Candidatus Eremiobacteraeota bacterium]|nr:hypothetical protein [Candidatus Eremiobacteraeota bacterium]
MGQRDPIIVEKDSGSLAGIAVALVVIVAIVAALFLWHPWTSSTSSTSTTTVTQPGAAGNGSYTTQQKSTTTSPT